MTMKIIQWNMNGYINNYCELQTIIKKHSPLIISLQETHIKFTSHIPIPINYILISKNTSSFHGGVGLLAHKSLQAREITLSVDFDAV